MYTPDAVTEPPAAPSCTDQATPVPADPVTEAVNAMAPPGPTWEERGERMTTMPVGAGPFNPFASVLGGDAVQAAVAVRHANSVIRRREIFMVGVP